VALVDAFIGFAVGRRIPVGESPTQCA